MNPGIDQPFTRREPRIVALGGGHGLYATLSAARRLTHDITAVVTVSDDGGSSGRIRSELGIVPPGDLRMALAALASDSPRGRMWATAIQHRLGGNGGLAGHPIGNLILAGLTDSQLPSALGTCVVLNGLIKNRGEELKDRVPEGTFFAFAFAFRFLRFRFRFSEADIDVG